MPSNCVHVDAHDCQPDVYRQELRRARKAYRCGECGDEIQAADLYEAFTALYEGVWATYRTCARCVNVRDDYFKGGWIFERIAEDFFEAFGFDYRQGIPADFAPCGKESVHA